MTVQQTQPKGMLIVVDTETTGLDSMRHRIIELAFEILDIKIREVLCQYEAKLQINAQQYAEGNKKAYEVNGFTKDMIGKGKSCEEVAEEVIEIFENYNISKNNAYWMGQNPKFDDSFLAQVIPKSKQYELKWPYHSVDTATMFHSLQMLQVAMGKKYEFVSLSKDDIAKSLGVEPESKPHSALNGVKHAKKLYFIIQDKLRELVT